MKFLYLFLIFCLSSHSHGCDDHPDQCKERMLIPCIRAVKDVWGPFEYTQTEENNTVRQRISEATSGEIDKMCACISMISQECDPLTLCYDYALRRFLNDPSIKAAPPSLRNAGFKGIINTCLQLYCTLNERPKAGDLVVYYNTQNRNDLDMNFLFIPVHFGIVEEDGFIASKWGEDIVYRHSSFCVPKKYGDRVEYFTLKKDADLNEFKDYVISGVSLV